MQNYFLFWFELVVCLVWFPTECWSLAIFMNLQYSLSRRKLCTPSSREIVQCRGTLYFYVYECLLACLYLPLVVSGAAGASSGNRVKVAVTCHVGAGEKWLSFLGAIAPAPGKFIFNSLFLKQSLWFVLWIGSGYEAPRLSCTLQRAHPNIQRAKIADLHHHPWQVML